MLALLLLKCLLFLAFIAAPIQTNFYFLGNNRAYRVAHVAALVLAAIAMFGGVGPLAFAWPLFCAFGFILVLKQNRQLATLIPAAFSLISAVWFSSGANDLHLLGYDVQWSFYAAIHGAFIGWLFTGAVAERAKHDSRFRAGTFAILVLFLFVAFGINGVPVLKQVGVIGFSILMPALMVVALNSAKDRKANICFSIAITMVAASMVLALLNEFWAAFPRNFEGFPTMALTHGVINAVVAVPVFCLGIFFSRVPA